uniref:DUF4283 domain-containing protein n=1 Tax=Chenopodium quinoa TaxID=63459 RepID=A0A803LW51_CHEQI
MTSPQYSDYPSRKQSCYKPHYSNFHRHLVLGKFVDYRHFSEHRIQDWVSNQWIKFGEITVQKFNNIFLFLCEDARDRDAMLEQGASAYQAALLVFKPWTSGNSIRDISFKKAAIWVQLNEVPLNLCEIDVVRPMLSMAGKIPCVDKPLPDPIFERLGRAYVSSAWFLDYPDTKVLHQPILFSDHAAIILSDTIDSGYVKRPYRVEYWCLSASKWEQLQLPSLSSLMGSPQLSSKLTGLTLVRPLFRRFNTSLLMGRLLTDNALIAHEVLSFMNNLKAKKRFYATIKLDMNKAHDRVSPSACDNLMALMTEFCGLSGHVINLQKSFGVVEAIDGSHIKMTVPFEYRPRYRDRKGDISTKVLETCDSNLCFTYVLPAD